jgi:hypothetical protein
MTLRRTLNKVQISSKLSDNFETTHGLRQGDALSTLLFNIMLLKAICNIELNTGGSIFTRTKQYMAYADDVAVIERSLQAVNEVIQQMKEPTLTIGLDINVQKMKYINTSRSRQQDAHTRTVDINRKVHQEVRDLNTWGQSSPVITTVREI